ncbi:MAG: argininosuccinate lyase, partial [Holophaga sp.]|nr:argininosuccinate lyase [Holophaga sp.]
MAPETSPLWSKNLPLDRAIHHFTVGDEPTTDRALLAWDAIGSAAHARTLAKGGYLAHEDVQALLVALKELH